MEKEESRITQNWNANHHKLRLLSSHRYNADHKKETWSPVSPRSPLSTRSQYSARSQRSARSQHSARSPLSAGIPTSTSKLSRANSARGSGSSYSIQKKAIPFERRNTVSTGKRASPVERRGTVSTGKRVNPVERRGTVSGPAAEDPFGIRNIFGDEPSQPSEGSRAKNEEYDDDAEAREVLNSIGLLDGSTRKWEKKADSNGLPYSSSTLPSNAPSEAGQELGHKEYLRGSAGIRIRNESHIKSRTSRSGSIVDPLLIDDGGFSEVKDDQKHDPELQPSESEEPDGNYDENFPKSRLTNVPNEGDNGQGHIGQMKRYAMKNYPLKSHPKHRDSDHDSRLQSSNSGNAVLDDDSVIIKDFGSWNPLNKQDRDHDRMPQSQEVDHSIDETNERENHAVSDTDQKPNETAISSETPRSAHSNRHDSPDSQTQSSISDPTLLNETPIHNYIEGQVYPEINKTGVATDTTHFLGTMESKTPDSQPNFHRIDQIKSADPQTNLPESGLIKIPDSQPQSPEPRGVTVEISPTGDPVGEDFDPETWLNSDSPLPGNYRAIFDNEFDDDSSISRGSTNPDNGTDSLVVSPVRPGELDNSEEDEDPSASKADKDFMKLLAEYKANFHLNPSSEEQKVKEERRAKGATDRQNGRFRSWNSESLSLSSSDSEEPLIMSPGQEDETSISPKTLQPDLEKARDEAASQDALKLLELDSANVQLKKELEEKEAKFKREIEIAWTQPRPPPTTAELDRIALEKIESVTIFDEVGDQQRPIRTEPQLVSLEINVNIMIDRARVNYTLENFPQMYTHANNAVVAVAPLQFPQFTAKCCYYRGLASYHYGDFGMAKEDFLASRGCAGLWGISSENIEKYIDLIDKADDPATAVLERLPNPKFVEVRTTKRRTATRSANVDNEKKPSASTAEDAPTLVGGSPTSPHDIALPLPPISSANEGERAAGQVREDANSRIQTLRRPSRLGRLPLESDPQPKTDEVPNYQPQEEAISEEIRKDIFESKAQSLDPVSEASPAEANLQATTTLSPPSMASTEWTLLGSATSQGTAAHVPRLYVAPIATSFTKAMSTPAVQASPEATLVSGSTDEIDEDEIMAAFGRGRDDSTTISGSEDERDGYESD